MNFHEIVIVILSILIIVLFFGGLFYYFDEKRQWNNGFSRETGKPWHLRDRCNNGDRMYKSPDGLETLWISYNVDKNYSGPPMPQTALGVVPLPGLAGVLSNIGK